ncbi:MAG TPA: carboxyltransferase subunit alpha [Candidatus Dormibacteraeota bacterium]|nr:carboxyltransferase subunit alpha [Candidatus Dormibacteraeota bacterium]
MTGAERDGSANAEEMASAWAQVEGARHPDRPYSLDLIERCLEDFIELHGDRQGGDDAAVVIGLARLEGRRVAVVANQKGRTLEERGRRNFGMAHPEGYRKAQRLFALAGRLELPVLSFIDTPGAYPGVAAEERGQAWAIAQTLEAQLALPTPYLAVVIGEGGSGGALATLLADAVLVLEHAFLSVASPEAAAAILFRDAGRKQSAAAALRLEAQNLLDWGIADEIVPEPPGGAHTDWDGTAALLRPRLLAQLARLASLGVDPGRRRERYRRLDGLFQL